MSNVEELLSASVLDRRALLRGAGTAGAGLFLGGFLTGCGGHGGNGIGTHNGVTDTDILNFALNLEYLEAEYYLRAVNGTGLGAGDRGANPGTVTGGSAVPFATQAYREYAQEIADDEQNHVRYLRTALGSAAVDEPAIDLAGSFDAAAAAAGIGATFNPFADEVNFLLGAFIFEDVGVTAYHGAAPLIGSKDILNAAAGILGVEAYHSGVIRTTLFSIGGSAITNAQKISDLRDSVDGPDDDDQGLTAGGVANLVPADSNSIAFARTTSQVLNIVYLNGNGTPGGFFPGGLNGRIR